VGIRGVPVFLGGDGGILGERDIGWDDSALLRIDCVVISCLGPMFDTSVIMA